VSDLYAGNYSNPERCVEVAWVDARGDKEECGEAFSVKDECGKS
jgi:hypothetical protein